MTHVVLVGLPGSGKTTVGRALAHALSGTFVDVDDVFWQREGVSVQEFLRTHDESDFRRRELRALRQALQGPAVVATGGGTVTIAAARAMLATEFTVWLDCPDEVLTNRVRDGDRPLLGEDPATRLAELRAKRQSLYEEVSAFRVDAGRPVDAVVDELLIILETPRTSP